ncbi:hypothetical protein CPB86DRAFT_379151 [Serendipita vermifera]|nr:hypothetical protein CPB86DRAFT_379151 [Serendipita vermifera]
MTSSPHHLCNIDPILYAQGANRQWSSKSTYLSYPNAVGDIHTTNQYPLQDDSDVGQFPMAKLNVASTHHPATTPIPLHASSHPDLHNTPPVQNPPNPNISPCVSAPMTTLTTAATAHPKSPLIISPPTRSKFACPWPSCGKLCTSQPRARTCLFNHMDLRPFACGGACGVLGW